jgi:hypothetical protein
MYTYMSHVKNIDNKKCAYYYFLTVIFMIRISNSVKITSYFVYIADKKYIVSNYTSM